jgi:hypothetical protein
MPPVNGRRAEGLSNYREGLASDRWPLRIYAGRSRLASPTTQGQTSGPCFGTSIDRRQADRLADAARPAARQAIDLADMLEQMGTSPEDIRAAAHDVLKDDPALGTIWKPHPDEDWRVELSGGRG